jgi:hypothetical protein
MGKGGEFASYLATFAIVSAGVLSFTSLAFWLGTHWPSSGHDDHAAAHAGDHPASASDKSTEKDAEKKHGDHGHDSHAAHVNGVGPHYPGN